MIKKVLILIVCLSILAVYCYGEEIIIRPTKSANDIRLTHGSLWWDLNRLEERDRVLCQTLYIRGFLDAVTLFEGKATKIHEFTTACEGMTINQMIDTINKFYEDYPEKRDFSPATIMIGVIPRLRKGLSPFLLEEVL